MLDIPLTHPLTYLLELRGWGKVEFADLMQAHGSKLGVPLATNRTTVWKWEQGQTPDDDAQYVLADLLGVPQELARPELWPTWLPVWEVAGLRRPWTLAGTVDALDDLVRSAHMDRRGFLTITGATLSALAASWATAPSAFAAAADGDRVTDEMVSTLEQRVTTLRSLDAQMGGARLLDQARSDLALITTMIKQARYIDAVGERLHSLAAQVSYLTGWMAYDSGLHSQGQQYYVAALRAARTAGDNDLGAFVLAEMGVHASDGGYNKERAQLLNTAIDSSGTTIPTHSRAYLYLHLAAALAQQGNHHQAASALHRSTQLWDRSSGELPEWLAWFEESQINSTRGKIMLWAGHADQAADFLVASVDASVPRDRAVRAGRLAEAYLEGKNLDGALAAANEGAELLEQRVASGRALERLTEFSGKIGKFKSEPAVREFRERVKALPSPVAA